MPITVKPIAEETDSGIQQEMYEVIAGRRRVLAVTMLKWKEIICRILEGDEIEKADEIVDAENVNRLAMHPLDEASIFKKLIESGETVEGLAKRFDRSVSAIWQRIQLLDLIDDVKTLFYNGKIDLHCAVMLKGLDEEQQKMFCVKYRKENRVSIWDVKKFISSVRHDKLFECIAGKDCEKCKKRTFYTDKTLFPELTEEKDICLDHECYMGKWNNLLSASFKELAAEYRDHEKANVIICDDEDLRKIFVKSLTVNGKEYAIRKTSWGDSQEKTAKKGYLPCFRLEFNDLTDYDVEDDGEFIEKNEFTVTPVWWKEPAKEKKQSQSQQRDDPIGYLIGRECNKDILKQFAGTTDVKLLKKLPYPKLFTALYVSTFNGYSLPSIDDLGKGRSSRAMEFFGVKTSQLQEMYKEELIPLMPNLKATAEKPKATAPKSATAKKAQAKPAAKKPHTGLLQNKGKGKKNERT